MKCRLIAWQPSSQKEVSASVQSNTTTVVTTHDSTDNMDVNKSSSLPCIDDDDDHAQMIRAFDSLRV